MHSHSAAYDATVLSDVLVVARVKLDADTWNICMVFGFVLQCTKVPHRAGNRVAVPVDVCMAG